MEWKQPINNNQWVLAEDGKDFLISYINVKEFNIEETALMTCDDKYYILNGDFRKEFEQAFSNGLQSCMEVFNKFKEDTSSVWSD